MTITSGKIERSKTDAQVTRLLLITWKKPGSKRRREAAGLKDAK
jgi:hypothetical protein